MKHGFTCLCGECCRIARPLKLEAMSQWAQAVTEAQREQRAYSWHQCFKLLEARA